MACSLINTRWPRACFAVIDVLILFLHSAHSTYCTSQHSQHSLPSRHSTVLSQRSGASLPLQPHSNSHTICPLLTSNPSCESFFCCPAASPAAISPPLPSTPSPSFPLSLLPSRQTLILPTNPVKPCPKRQQPTRQHPLTNSPTPPWLGIFDRRPLRYLPTSSSSAESPSLDFHFHVPHAGLSPRLAASSRRPLLASRATTHRVASLLPQVAPPRDPSPENKTRRRQSGQRHSRD